MKFSAVPAACAAVQAAHRADVVVAEKAHDKVALAQKIAALGLRQLPMLLDGGEEQFFQFEHSRNAAPVEGNTA